MKRKWIAVVIPLACVLIIFIMAKTLKSELAPLEDHSVIRTMITAPEGTDFDYTENLLNRIAQAQMDSIPESRFVKNGSVAL